MRIHALAELSPQITLLTCATQPAETTHTHSSRKPVYLLPRSHNKGVGNSHATSTNDRKAVTDAPTRSKYNRGRRFGSWHRANRGARTLLKAAEKIANNVEMRPSAVISAIPVVLPTSVKMSSVICP